MFTALTLTSFGKRSAKQRSASRLATLVWLIGLFEGDRQNVCPITFHFSRDKSNTCSERYVTVHSQGGYSPVTSGLLSSLDEQGEADEIDGGSDGQRADVFQHQTHQSGETEHQLEQRGNQDGSLDL